MKGKKYERAGKIFFERKIWTVWLKSRKKNEEMNIFSKGDREVSLGEGQTVSVSEELSGKLSVYFLFIFITTVIPSSSVRSFVCLFDHG